MPVSLSVQLPYAWSKRHGAHLAATPNGVELLLRPDAGIWSINEVRRRLGTQGAGLRMITVSADEFERRLVEHHGGGEHTAAAVADDIDQELDLARMVEELPPVEDLLDSQHDAPMIRMINALLTQSIRERASDIHIEPYERHSAVRFRLDGLLRDVVAPNRALHAAMVSRIKIMAALDIAEKRLPQDGRISVRIGGRSLDVRVSTLPTPHGERVVMRLLEKDAARLDLTALGMAADTLVRVDRLIAHPHGIWLVTGPTGSGKTTTLYAALSRLDAKTRNIMTVEDPVEYDLAGIGQIQVNPRIELDFARALRAILRQDPDVIMIGEIRDLETARIAVQASLTGHLVMATLHTNDSASAVTRLTDMGIEPFLLASSLLGVLAQRLMRRLCPHCKVAYAADTAECALLGSAPGTTLWRPKGCPDCAGTGYRGRIGIYELAETDDRLRPLIHDAAGEPALREALLQGGHFRSMFDDGKRWVKSGETALEELLRVIRN